MATIPKSARPVGMVRGTAIFSKSIMIDLAHKLTKRRKRDRGQVASDYDAGEWAQQKRARLWSRSADLKAYVERHAVNRSLTALIDGRLWRLPAKDYYALRRQRLTAVLKQYAPDPAALIELGSGAGMNLFTLHLEDYWKSLLGLELSETGVSVARETADHFDVSDRIRFAHIDLLDPQSGGYAALEGHTVFTHYCLEQLPNDTEAVFRQLADAGVKRVICIEPSFELLKFSSLRDLASLSYVWRQDYQRTLVRVAQRMQARGDIRVLAAERLHFASSWRNAPTLLVWEPVVG
ncbi:MAG TPA: class I SAM-dependent methyltransferase [Sphingomicrobium sp.]|nr:class I SAM-dependent methyltransferase [Sphingomicrobium sp.]